MSKKLSTLHVDSSLHVKMKSIAEKNKTNLTYEVEKALKNYIKNEKQEEILIDSRIEILINNKMNQLDKHLSSYIGKLDKNIYSILASNVLILQDIKEETFEKYKESQIIDFLKYKGEIYNKADIEKALKKSKKEE